MTDWLFWAVRWGLIFWGIAGFLGFILFCCLALYLLVCSVLDLWDLVWAKVKRERDWHDIDENIGH